MGFGKVVWRDGGQYLGHSQLFERFDERISFEVAAAVDVSLGNITDDHFVPGMEIASVINIFCKDLCIVCGSVEIEVASRS